MIEVFHHGQLIKGRVRYDIANICYHKCAVNYVID